MSGHLPAQCGDSCPVILQACIHVFALFTKVYRCFLVHTLDRVLVTRQTVNEQRSVRFWHPTRSTLDLYDQVHAAGACLTQGEATDLFV